MDRSRHSRARAAGAAAQALARAKAKARKLHEREEEEEEARAKATATAVAAAAIRPVVAGSVAVAKAAAVVAPKTAGGVEHDPRSVSKDKVQWLLAFTLTWSSSTWAIYRRLCEATVERFDDGTLDADDVDLLQKMFEDGAVHHRLSLTAETWRTTPSHRRHDGPLETPNVGLLKARDDGTVGVVRLRVGVHYDRERPATLLRLVVIATAQRECCEFGEANAGSRSLSPDSSSDAQPPVVEAVLHFLETGEWPSQPEQEVLWQMMGASASLPSWRRVPSPESETLCMSSSTTFDRCLCVAELCRRGGRATEGRRAVDDGSEAPQRQRRRRRALQLASLLHELWYTRTGTLRFLLHLKSDARDNAEEEGDDDDDDKESEEDHVVAVDDDRVVSLAAATRATKEALLRRHEIDVAEMKDRLPLCAGEMIGAFYSPAPFGIPQPVMLSSWSWSWSSPSRSSPSCAPSTLPCPDLAALTLAVELLPIGPVMPRDRDRVVSNAMRYSGLAALADAEGAAAKARRRGDKRPFGLRGRLDRNGLQTAAEAYCVAVEKAYAVTKDPRLRDPWYFLKCNRPTLTTAAASFLSPVLTRERNRMGIANVADLLFKRETQTSRTNP